MIGPATPSWTMTAPNHYKSLIPEDLNIVHTTIEVHQCPSH